jgi:hypothetical protein
LGASAADAVNEVNPAMEIEKRNRRKIDGRIKRLAFCEELSG